MIFIYFIQYLITSTVSLTHPLRLLILFELTLSLPEPVKNLGLKDALTRLQAVYFPVLYHTPAFSAMRFDGNPFRCQCEKEKKKNLRVSNFAPLLVVFTWHRGSKGANSQLQAQYFDCSITCLCVQLWPLNSWRWFLNFLFDLHIVCGVYYTVLGVSPFC